MKKTAKVAMVLGALALLLGFGAVTYGASQIDPPFTLINLR